MWPGPQYILPPEHCKLWLGSRHAQGTASNYQYPPSTFSSSPSFPSISIPYSFIWTLFSSYLSSLHPIFWLPLPNKHQSPPSLPPIQGLKKLGLHQVLKPWSYQLNWGRFYNLNFRLTSFILELSLEWQFWLKITSKVNHPTIVCNLQYKTQDKDSNYNYCCWHMSSIRIWSDHG